MWRIDNEEIRARLERAMGQRLALYHLRALSLPELEIGLSAVGHDAVSLTLRASREQASMLPGTTVSGPDGVKGALLRSVCGVTEYVFGFRYRTFPGFEMPTALCLASDVSVTRELRCRACRRVLEVVKPDAKRLATAIRKPGCWHESIDLTAAEELEISCLT